MSEWTELVIAQIASVVAIHVKQWIEQGLTECKSLL